MSPRRAAEAAVVPDAAFRSYYGEPILNPPVWKSRDIAGYFFFGGLAGASSVIAAAASMTGRARLARRSKVGALAAIGVGAVALVHDLGRPERFANMLRVFKPTSPMSVGSWLLAFYGPATGVAALSDVTGVLPGAGVVATAAAALLGPAVAAYTAALIADTAVPAWHEAYRELPFVFVGSAAAAGAGLGLVVAPVGDNTGPARLALLGVATDLTAVARLKRRLGMLAEPYEQGMPGRLMRAAAGLEIAGVVIGVAGRRHRLAAAVAGAALLAGSACTRWGVFHAGVASARDPRYTVVPQRARLG